VAELHSVKQPQKKVTNYVAVGKIRKRLRKKDAQKGKKRVPSEFGMGGLGKGRENPPERREKKK